MNGNYIPHLTTEDLIIWSRKSDASRRVHAYMARMGDDYDFLYMRARTEMRHLFKMLNRLDEWPEVMMQATLYAMNPQTHPDFSLALAMTDIGSSPAVH